MLIYFSSLNIFILPLLDSFIISLAVMYHFYFALFLVSNILIIPHLILILSHIVTELVKRELF